MFERYTQAARHAIALARDEAAAHHSADISSGFVLLGLIRAAPLLAANFKLSEQSLREKLQSMPPAAPAQQPPINLPLAEESKWILVHAAEEAERQNHRHIGCEHLLVGILNVEDCFASRILREVFGLTLEAARQPLWERSTLPAGRAPEIRMYRKTTRPEFTKQGDFPEVLAFGVEVFGASGGTWLESFSTEDQLRAFFRGMQAGSIMTGGPHISLPCEFTRSK